MVNLVIVSHSARLGEGVAELAGQMLHGDGCRLAVAAGIDDPDSPIGTDPLKVMAAIESLADADAVLVMMDMGSALLSAETALDLLDPAIAARVHLCAAPLVEGTLAAAVSAASGAGIDKVMADAMAALEAKRAQLGMAPAAPQAPVPQGEAERSVTVVISNRNGLHVRPASRLVAALAGFDARLALEKAGRRVVPDSINQIALLQVRQNDRVTLLASGPDAEAAIAAFTALAESHFGEDPQAETAAPPLPPRVSGSAVFWPQPGALRERQQVADSDGERRRLQQAIADTLTDLDALAARADAQYGADIGAIFAGHRELLDDPELLAAADEMMREQQCDAGWAWQQVMSDMSQQYRQLSDDYLQARYIDIDDLRQRTLDHLDGRRNAIPGFSAPAILVCDDIFPSTVLQLDPQQVKGICLRGGSERSHGAIIARAAGIAFLSQQGEALASLRSGQPLTLDLAAHQLIAG
ncbi:dihydroxyacetone kinase subunit DhaM [Pluralibacter gergoviae]|uniref:dihydroxyacetone kinase phosphoryl donor subunit DhaM n=1 Tax=Pluralibacter gergoviae TaxID=61647 RepID=UPI0005EC9190|nr:dihydroxyacetone kinase phosphoryl donor subunit DhaM [Pluralibacter gergoviae]KJM65438.1 DhaM [Pluralibacter gergoviae]OUR03745.1 dihydroxyacetone kinase subunit DhaM [Pluralibacter gergoviae]